MGRYSPTVLPYVPESAIERLSSSLARGFDRGIGLADRSRRIEMERRQEARADEYLSLQQGFAKRAEEESRRRIEAETRQRAIQEAEAGLVPHTDDPALHARRIHVEGVGDFDPDAGTKGLERRRLVEQIRVARPETSEGDAALMVEQPKAYDTLTEMERYRQKTDIDTASRLEQIYAQNEGRLDVANVRRGVGEGAFDGSEQDKLYSAELRAAIDDVNNAIREENDITNPRQRNPARLQSLYKQRDQLMRIAKTRLGPDFNTVGSGAKSRSMSGAEAYGGRPTPGMPPAGAQRQGAVVQPGSRMGPPNPAASSPRPNAGVTDVRAATPSAVVDQASERTRYENALRAVRQSKLPNDQKLKAIQELTAAYRARTGQ